MGPPGPASSAYFGATFDGGNADIAPGAFCDVRVPYPCTLTRASVLAVPAGSLTIDVRAAPFISFPPTGADSIVGTAPPGVSAASTYEDPALEDWEANVAAGSVIRFFVTACNGVRRATILLEGIRE